MLQIKKDTFQRCPPPVQNGSTRLRNLTIFHWLWSDCDTEVDSRGPPGLWDVLLHYSPVWIERRGDGPWMPILIQFFLNSYFDRFLSRISHFLHIYDLKVTSLFSWCLLTHPSQIFPIPDKAKQTDNAFIVAHALQPHTSHAGEVKGYKWDGRGVNVNGTQGALILREERPMSVRRRVAIILHPWPHNSLYFPPFQM